MLTQEVASQCKPLAATAQAQAFWLVFSEHYGALPLPGTISVCTGKQYFFEVKGGAKMQSALDRKHGRILLRNTNSAELRHEMAHIYLDMRWRILPYSVSEPFAKAMSQELACPSATLAQEKLGARWRNRHSLNACELLRLLKDILAADRGVREGLPLN